MALNYGPVIQARFIHRPNRFIVVCDASGLGRVRAFLPNPGRLWELFLPEAVLYLAPARDPNRRTKYTVLAVERDGCPIFLDTHATNHVARYLIEQGQVPGLERAEIVRAEVPMGNSRFDFLLRQDGHLVYTEVKSVTLFGNGVAMFPDAVTARGRRHLLELAKLEGAAVVFLVHYPHVQWFMPDFHTDLAFSETFLEVRDKVRIVPVAVGWRKDLSLRPHVELLGIPWDYLEREVQDRGSYLLVLRLKRARRIEVGRLGACRFEAGYHVYVGSAMRNLSQRVARHLRKRKKHHWHIDYLRDVADDVVAVPIRSSLREECEVAQALATILAPGTQGFGCSDCDCATHLFHSKTFPLSMPAFHEVLQRFRMRRPPDSLPANACGILEAK